MRVGKLAVWMAGMIPADRRERLKIEIIGLQNARNNVVYPAGCTAVGVNHEHVRQRGLE